MQTGRWCCASLHVLHKRSDIFHIIFVRLRLIYFKPGFLRISSLAGIRHLFRLKSNSASGWFIINYFDRSSSLSPNIIYSQPGFLADPIHPRAGLASSLAEHFNLRRFSLASIHSCGILWYYLQQNIFVMISITSPNAYFRFVRSW
jgi:hypothetical protein